MVLRYKNNSTQLGFRLIFTSSKLKSISQSNFTRLMMNSGIKRANDVDGDDNNEHSLDEPSTKISKITNDHDKKDPDSENTETKVPSLKHDRNRFVNSRIVKSLTEYEIRLIRDVKSSCRDYELTRAAIKLRLKHRLCARLPEDDEDSSYYIEGGLRRVYPYQYLFQASAKRRWLGRKLTEIIRTEFRDISDESLEYRFKNNRIIVNGDSVDIDYIVKSNDFICNFAHRHELPVLPAPIKIIHEDANTVVINKPPSLPIHPCGRFRWNCVLNVLKLENNMNDLKVCHRLDRLVSGVMIFAKNSRRAHEMEQNIQEHKVSKVYVCRVSGEFPLGPADEDGEIVVDQPLEHLPGKIGITVVMAEGKASKTRFKRLHYNGKTSAVLCKPQSGRMHQIRVHLQFLGHPIVNDKLYNSDAFGSDRGKGAKFGKSLQQLSRDILEKHRSSTWLMDGNECVNEPHDGIETNQTTLTRATEEVNQKTVKFLSDEEKEETSAALESYCSKESLRELEKRWPYDDLKYIRDPACNDCHNKYHDPPPRNLFMYLHALSYTGPGFHYETELPSWALEFWQY